MKKKEKLKKNRFLGGLKIFFKKWKKGGRKEKKRKKKEKEIFKFLESFLLKI